MKTFLDVIKSGFLRINSISVTVLSVQEVKPCLVLFLHIQECLFHHLGQPTSLILEPNIKKLAIHLDQLAALLWPQNDRIEIFLPLVVIRVEVYVSFLFLAVTIDF
jgi:hypothetical protein